MISANGGVKVESSNIVTGEERLEYSFSQYFIFLSMVLWIFISLRTKINIEPKIMCILMLKITKIFNNKNHEKINYRFPLFAKRE